MLTTSLVHPEILYHLAAAGHGAKVLITDGNYPASTKVNETVPVVYLNLRPNLVSVVDVLETLCSVCNFEKAEVMWPDDNHRPAIFDRFEEVLAPLKVTPIARLDFYEECVTSQDLVLAIVSGETTPYANILLTVGVTN
jgi:L-fucose mutarotase